MHEAGDQTKNGPAGEREPKLLTYPIGIGAFGFPVARAERSHELRADARVPTFIDAVENACQTRLVGALGQQAFQPAAEFRRGDLAGVSLADGREVRRIDQAALEERQLVVEFQPVDME